MATDKIGITLPQELRQKVDLQAALWLSDRSSTISRMLQEWFAHSQNGQVTHPEKIGAANSETPIAA